MCEFCGLDHGRMTFAVEVVNATDFEAWLASEPRDDDQRGAHGPPTTVGEPAPPGRQTGGRPVMAAEEPA